jgi:hypothetical protein
MHTFKFDHYKPTVLGEGDQLALGREGVAARGARGALPVLYVPSICRVYLTAQARIWP